MWLKIILFILGVALIVVFTLYERKLKNKIESLEAENKHLVEELSKYKAEEPKAQQVDE